MEEAITRINNWIALNDPGKILNLAHLNLKQLPPIPLNCERLFCDNNQLTSLPQLPNCVILACHYNKLTSLPELPKCRDIYCYHNQLTYLPQLPCCTAVWCFGNKYLYVDKYLVKKLGRYATLNYNKYATIIQRNYKKHLRNKYNNIISQFLFAGPSKIVCLYTI